MQIDPYLSPCIALKCKCIKNLSIISDTDPDRRERGNTLKHTDQGDNMLVEQDTNITGTRINN